MSILAVGLYVVSAVAGVVWITLRNLRSSKIRSAVQSIDPIRPGDAFEALAEAKEFAERWWPYQRACSIACVVALVVAILVTIAR